MLKDGSEPEDPRLDRIYPGVEAHLPSLNYLVRAMPLNQKPFRSYTWYLDVCLNQMNEGRCVEFSLCHEFLAKPKPIEQFVVDDILANKKIYWPAQEVDQWPGGSYPGASPVYEGTSLLAGAQVSQGYGFYHEYRWALDTDEMARAVGYGGPVVLGCNWYQGMVEPDADGWIRIGDTSLAGGHCICVIGVHVVYANGDPDREHSYFVLHNSWGVTWGQKGRAKLSWNDMARLISEQGEVMLPVLRQNVDHTV